MSLKQHGHVNLEIQTDGTEPVNGTRATYGSSWRSEDVYHESLSP